MAKATTKKTTSKETSEEYKNRYGRIDAPIELLPDSDDEGVNEHCREVIREFSNGRMGYFITVRRDGRLLTFTRGGKSGHGIPCWGELAKYRATHGDMGHVNDYRPTDLFYPFPEGEVVRIGIFGRPIYFFRGSGLAPFLASPESPFSDAIKGFGNIEYVEVKSSDKRTLEGFFVKDVDIDPTVFLLFCRTTGWISGSSANLLKIIDGMKFDTGESLNRRYQNLFFYLFGCSSDDTSIPFVGIPSMAYHGASIPRLFIGDFEKISMGTFKEGYGYTRSKNEYMLGPYGSSNASSFQKLRGAVRGICGAKDPYSGIGLSVFAEKSEEIAAVFREEIDNIMVEESKNA